ncbi:MAG: Ribosomal large subunit pseudouridine synthase [Bacteroidota bacterium]|jgi:23S rRNA pseudouridine2605 synthase
MKKSFKPRRNESGSDKPGPRKRSSQDKPAGRRSGSDRNQDDKPASFKTRRSNFNNFDNPRFINDKDSVTKKAGWDDFDAPSDRKRPSRDNDDRPKRSFSRDNDDRPKRSFSRNNDDRPKRAFSRDNDDRPKRSFSRDNDDRPKRSFSRDNDDRPKRSFSRDNDDRPKRAFSRDNDEKPKRSYSRDNDDRPKRTFSRDNDEKPKRSFSRDNDERPKRSFSRDNDERPKRSFSRDNDERPKRAFSRDNDEKPKRSFSRDNDDRPKRAFSRDNDEKPKRSYSRDNDDRPKRAFSRDNDEKPKRSYSKDEDRPKRSYNKSDKGESKRGYSAGREEFRSKKSQRGTFTENGAIRLNRYISMAGICSRREADEMILAGVVSVNGVVVTELGTKVEAGDDIRYNGERLKNETHRYILLNKPKDYITTMEDPNARKTVMELISGACRERVYPVGRLDRLTTGLLLFTNDGELAKVLTHPSSLVRKIYHVELSKNVKASDLKLIAEGVELEDGFMQVDQVAYDGDGTDKKMVGLQIHSGKNRIVRRIFEHLGYEVVKLDRVMFAGLTKKDLPRGRYRSLTETEVGMLKMISPKRMKGLR